MGYAGNTLFLRMPGPHPNSNAPTSAGKTTKNARKKQRRRAVVERLVPAARAQGRVLNFYKLGPCASKYAASLADPFTGPPDACLPVSPSVSSRKCRTFARGVMAIGTAGAGFVLITPRLANDSGGATSNAVYYTDSTFATSAISQNSATAGVLLAQSNSDYTTAQLVSSTVGSTIQARLVSMGLRLRYRGTELNRGGRILTLEEPDHGTLQGATSSVLLAYERCHEHSVTSGRNDWVKVQYSGPVAPTEYDFVTPQSIPGAGIQGGYLVAFVESTAANQFDWEAFWNWEIIGAPVRGKSYNEADDQGTAVVLGAVRNQNDAGLDSRSPIVQNPGKIVPYADSYASNNLSGFLAKAANDAGEALMMAPNPILRGGGAVLKGGAALYNWFKGAHH